jgi:rod shape-determining protein MreC
MQTKKLSSRVFSYAKSTLAAAALPVFLIYVLVGKPDYRITNGLAHIVLPAANRIGDIVSWPIRAIGDASESIRELSQIRSENDELRAKLAAVTRMQTDYEIALEENKKLNRELNTMRATVQKSIAARVSFDNSALAHNTFFIDKGMDSGIEQNMAVVSFDGVLIGTIMDTGANFAKVRGLGDVKSNIPVRIAGTQVYGFLQGNGETPPTIGFFSDAKFQPTRGLKLITSGIRGISPDGIMVGELENNTDASIVRASDITDVMVLKFDDKQRYK